MAGEQKKDISTGMVALLDVPVGKRVRLVSINSTRLQARLRQLGLYPGDCLRVMRIAPLDGPLLVEAHEREIALGRPVAEEILVEDELCESR